MNSSPTIIASRDGRRGIQVLYEGSRSLVERDVSAFYFKAWASPGTERGRIVVQFDGLSMLTLKPSDFGLVDTSGELAFVHFAEVAIGDRLDEGEFELSATGPAVSIDCFSETQEQWRSRSPATAEAIESYVRGKLYWGWEFEQSEVVFTSPDYLRMGVGQSRFLQVLDLGQPSDWVFARRTPFASQIKPSDSLIRSERDKRREASSRPSVPSIGPVFVDVSRLDELRRISGSPYDLRRLIALCEELNSCSAANAFHAVAMLTRAVIDHVPPIFGCRTFAEVASNYAGSKSFKDSMAHLSTSARKIGDAHLHVQIRTKEVLPTRTQVDFSRDLDVLLSEVVRLLA